MPRFGLLVYSYCFVTFSFEDCMHRQDFHVLVLTFVCCFLSMSSLLVVVFFFVFFFQIIFV